jgi:hypothetical protein
MTAHEPELDLSAVPDGAIKELHRQGELCLQGTVQLAIAADQRATTTSGILGAGSIALMVAGASMVLNPASRPTLIGAVFGVAFTLLSGAILCARAARSIDYFVAGYEPRLLAKSASDEIWMLRCAAEDIQARINHNRKTLEKSSKMLTLGRAAAFAALPVGIMIFTIMSAGSAGWLGFHFS